MRTAVAAATSPTTAARSVVVATSSEKVNMLDALADGLQGVAGGARRSTSARPCGRSTSPRATRRASSPPAATGPTRTPERWPTLWSPASTVWTERVAAAASPSLVGEPESFTRTPVVFGVPETMARALGWPDAADRHHRPRAAVLRPDGLGERRQAALGLVQDLEDQPEHLHHGALGDPHAVVRGVGQDRRPHGRGRRRGRGLLARRSRSASSTTATRPARC